VRSLHICRFEIWQRENESPHQSMGLRHRYPCTDWRKALEAPQAGSNMLGISVVQLLTTTAADFSADIHHHTPALLIAKTNHLADQ
jgi:hypothetical protein